MTTVGYTVQENIFAGGPSQKGVWKSTDLWWDAPLAALYLHMVCMTALNWEDERSEQYTFDHFWLREEVCGRVRIRLNWSWTVLQVVVVSAFWCKERTRRFIWLQRQPKKPKHRFWHFKLFLSFLINESRTFVQRMSWCKDFLWRRDDMLIWTCSRSFWHVRCQCCWRCEFYISKEVRRQQVGTRTRHFCLFWSPEPSLVSLVLRCKSGWVFATECPTCDPVFLVHWASPHWPTLNLVVGGLAQGLARGLREGCVSCLLQVP